MAGIWEKLNKNQGKWLTFLRFTLPMVMDTGTEFCSIVALIMQANIMTLIENFLLFDKGEYRKASYENQNRQAFWYMVKCFRITLRNNSLATISNFSILQNALAQYDERF